MTRFFSEALGKHDRSAFASGNERIDAYFRTAVSQDVKRHYAQCYVPVERETNRLAGFYSLSATNIPLAEIPAELARKLPRYPTVPAALIGWLGRDIGFRGQEIGAMLLRDAVVRVAASNIGVYALCADAIDDAAVGFYQRFLFTPFEGRPKSPFFRLRQRCGLSNGEASARLTMFLFSQENQFRSGKSRADRSRKGGQAGQAGPASIAGAERDEREPTTTCTPLDALAPPPI